VSAKPTLRAAFNELVSVLERGSPGAEGFASAAVADAATAVFRAWGSAAYRQVRRRHAPTNDYDHLAWHFLEIGGERADPTVLRLPTAEDDVARAAWNLCGQDSLAWPLVVAAVRAIRDAAAPPAHPPAAPNGTDPCPLRFHDGGFTCYGVEMTLPGMPLAILRVIAGRPDFRASERHLREILYPSRERKVVEMATIRKHVGKARAALQKAMARSGLRDAPDPLRCVDRGPALAWELRLPASPGPAENS
jgi:hypothetical protein